MNLPPELFVDTSFLIALLNSNDDYHQLAMTLQSQLAKNPIRKITSEYVLIELGDGLSRLRFRQLAGRLIALIYQDPSFEVIPASPGLFTKAVTLFNERPDKEWGLTDCTSIIAMQELGLDTVLTADRHFRQAGFRALLLEPAE